MAAALRAAAIAIPKSSFASLTLTANQITYLAALKSPSVSISIVTGPAGSGKTAIASNYALEQLLRGAIEKIVISRPNKMLNEDSIGYLPGTLVEKSTPLMLPIIEFLGGGKYDAITKVYNMIKEQRIEMCPLAFIRGRTFDNCIIIADEMQNSEPNQMKALLTRVGKNSQMIITGDRDQSDIPHANGLDDFLEKYRHYSDIYGVVPDIQHIALTNADIKRSKVVKKIIEIYDKSK
jgi:phosphate starvation-inducible PhoH-like protein